MQDKLKIWKPGVSWEKAEKEWETGSVHARAKQPIKTLTSLPRMLGIAEKGLKFKSVKYLLSQDKNHVFSRYFFRHPFQYTWRWIKSALKQHSYVRNADFFFYGIKNEGEFQELIQQKDVLLVIGFSYCHKPFECPSGRFSADCIHDPENAVCRQCFIGKAVNALPVQENIIPLFIPTVHYIGEKMFELTETNPDKQVLFLITACEMTLEMFGNWGNMVGVRGIGVRLDGRICNTMKAFELSEQGIKPGLTVVLPETQARILELIKSLWLPTHVDDEKA